MCHASAVLLENLYNVYVNIYECIICIGVYHMYMYMNVYIFIFMCIAALLENVYIQVYNIYEYI